MHYKARTITTTFPEKMSASTPVAIGTRGTVGSLLRKEIEYFTKIELDRCASSRRTRGQMVDMASRSEHSISRPSFWSLSLNWKRKKRRGNSSVFLPSICSAVEVADTNRLNGIPGFSYKILTNDEKGMTV
ncbi:uncharacterized protein LOC110605035 [Manihot esculenta]|uniref:Uncharacterized protein n=1 Tax=Manihot esculenta TaxID=3983 RepID=A0A2C9U4J3_MANES|nr:uncharacterized protein LOC110605035 [Manihot esculenta]OAY24707.1 hypothetical protein MANES_17G037200v8 [Manihot esculenta]